MYEQISDEMHKINHEKSIKLLYLEPKKLFITPNANALTSFNIIVCFIPAVPPWTASNTTSLIWSKFHPRNTSKLKSIEARRSAILHKMNSFSSKSVSFNRRILLWSVWERLCMKFRPVCPADFKPKRKRFSAISSNSQTNF